MKPIVDLTDLSRSFGGKTVLALGGEIVESRDATLEEIFLARAGRSRQPVAIA